MFEKITPKAIASYYVEQPNVNKPFLGEMFFPNKKQIGLDLSWFKGKGNLPVALVASEFDTEALVRDREGFEKLSASMPFFREKHTMGETLRQDLLKAEQLGDVYLNEILVKVFDENVDLIRAAAVSREIERSQLLSTGSIGVVENGVDKLYNYGFDATTQKKTATVLWTTPATATPLADLQAMKDAIQDRTGDTDIAFIIPVEVLDLIRKCKEITDWFNKQLNPQNPTRDRVKAYLESELGATIYIPENNKYRSARKKELKYFYPLTRVIALPNRDMGNTMFGTTPEEADLMASSLTNAEVELVDTGVAITTAITTTTPVNKDVVASEVCLPTAPGIDGLQILVVSAEV